MNWFRILGAGLTAAGVGGLSQAAVGADVPMKAPSHMTAAAPDWAGFYVGVNAGYSRGRSDPAVTFTADPNSAAASAALPGLSPSSLIGGFQAGYNAQFGRWLLGGEMDFSWLDAKADAFVEPFWVNSFNLNRLTMSSRYDWLATARLRAGALVSPDLLIYATGGLAMTRVQDHADYRFLAFGPPSIWSETRTLFGGAIGGGFEYAFAPRWTVKGEYLHAAFNDVSPQWTTAGTVASTSAKFAHAVDIGRIGVNYRWGAPQAVAANGAGIPTRAPAVANERWRGLYAGLHAGYAWGGSDPFTMAETTCVPEYCLTGLPTVRPGGFIGGGQAGYNWQSGLWVLGGEVDFSGLGANAEVTTDPLYTGDPMLVGNGIRGTFSSRYDWLATARLRAGALITADLMLYATGGLAIAGAKDSVVTSSTVFPEMTWAQSKAIYGATLGAGVEYALSRHWSLKLEYLHAEFNKTAPQTDSQGYLPPKFGFNHRLDIARVGVNYKLD
ncbi:MAG: outer membrane beta-barrel protein [Pseudomonadota bacterium]